MRSKECDCLVLVNGLRDGAKVEQWRVTFDDSLDDAQLSLHRGDTDSDDHEFVTVFLDEDTRRKLKRAL